jgi:RNA polymerase sigma-70 factor (ECF subfamily)
MATLPTATGSERELLTAAGRGDQAAFGRLVEPYRGQLHAHCYRMLGSVHDAEDALQEALLRAWKALGRFEGRSSLRSWLYTIATNTCLNAIARRPKRVLPLDYAGPTDPYAGPGEPIVESIWIEPYPDEPLGLPDGLAGPDARYEQREAVELAFIAALQHLPASQRAVLILREVLGFSAKEVAEQLETTVASVNSAMQRARAAVDAKLPGQSQQETLRTLGDPELQKLVTTYVDAWERNDVETVVAMLSEEATISMPPLATWFGPGPERMGTFLREFPLSGTWTWKTRITRANGQPAVAFYVRDARESEGPYLPFALNVLDLRGDKVHMVTAFVARAIDAGERERYHRWVDEDVDEERFQAFFTRFGVPELLED